MRSLLEKIEAEAALKLAIPPGVHPRQELARYRNFHKVQSARLRILHRNGGGGREVCQGRAMVLDVMLRHLVEALRAAALAEHPKSWPTMALVAYGGYGRAELNPRSDLDIMFLMARLDANHPCLALISEGILSDLDIGKVGHCTRTPADCVKMARDDMKSKTALLEARLITGSRELFDRFQAEFLAKCINGREAEYLAARLADQQQRHNRYGDSPLMQEPEIKSGCGGLRDYQNLFWMTQVKFHARSPAELAQKKLISDTEARDLERAYDFLLRVRTELHYNVARASDVLRKSLQPKIANQLGFKDKSPWLRLEKFMRVYYTHARNIYLITSTIEKRLALAPAQNRLLPALSGMFKRPSPTVDGLHLSGGLVQAATPRVFDDSPRRLMRAFLHAQQRGLELHPDLAQLIRNKLSLVDREFLRDPHVRATFLEILNHRGNVGGTLRAMHETGLLGRYLPEFGRLTNLVQHEFYHQYAADEHTLVCLEKLDQVWKGQAEPFSHYTALLQSLEKPFLLNLALLLHDAGKAGNPRSHAETGARLAVRVARRLELDPAAAGTLANLIRQHLAMSRVCQRLDLGDPSVIRHFADLVRDEETLKMLTLLTFADTLGTSDKLWNGFKDTLLRLLYHKTRDFLRGDADLSASAEKARDLLAIEVARQLPPPITEEELYAHFKNLPARYFAIHQSREIIADLQLAHRLMRRQVVESGDTDISVLHPIIAWHNQPDRGCTEVKLCTWDRPRLFSRIAGACSAAGLNILGAQIFTRADGIALDTFTVTDAEAGGVAGAEARQNFTALINRLLERTNPDLHRLIQRRKLGHSLYHSLEGESFPTRIHFDNHSSAEATLIEIETEDRVGLLYAVAQALADLALDISFARILTEKGAACDTFYVTHRYQGKITSPELQQKIRAKLLGAIVTLESVHDAS